jgi:hypothetical protein
LSSSLPPLLDGLTTEQFRQKIAGLLDQHQELPVDFKEEQKNRAIEFVACLPEVFGSELERTTLWDRIGTALQSAYAKTVGTDYEFFISRVMEHIKAEPASVARCQTVQWVMEWLADCPDEARQAWLAYMHTHLYAVLVHAKARWELTKADRKSERESNSRMEVANA